MAYKIKITKPTYNALTENDPRHIIFSSDYGTLKYFIQGSTSITINCQDLDTVGWSFINHNLGYYPYVEAYLKNPNNEYEYLPIQMSGASTGWNAYIDITTTQIKFYIEAFGFTTQQTFYIYFYIFNNNLLFSG